MNSQLLSLAIWVPILGALPVFWIGSERRALVRWLSLLVAIAGFLVTIPLYTGFDVSQAGMQFVEKTPWITRFNVQYFLGVDGISMPFILLISLITIFVVLAGWEVIEEKQAQYMGAFLVMSGLMNGIFSALDGILFYVFFEASLIPMYIIIGVWGGPNPRLCSLQVLPLHAARVIADAGCLDLAVPRSRRQLQHPRLARDAHRHGAADPDLRCLPGLLRSQGSDVAGTHMVA